MAGLLLAGLVLTKAAFLYAIVPVLVLCLAGAGLRRHRRWLAPALLVTIGFALPTAAWVVRNGEALDTWAVTEGRSGPILLTRERLNDMTAREYLIAFVYWTRGFGDNLAEDIFGPDSYRRLSVDTPDGFYGEALADYPRRVDAYAAEHGTTLAQARRLVDAEIKGDIVADLPRHLAVTLPVFYRGLWVDEFIVWTLPSLLWIGWLSLRRRACLALVWLYPAAFSLLFHALFTLNLPRFHIPATASLAIAGALAVGEIVDRRRRGPRRPRQMGKKLHA
jgi:4-amino-4-deoxy-L-arabinose transferase-like glycosyltransferase